MSSTDEEVQPTSSTPVNLKVERQAATDEDLFVLYVWPGDWDLPSLDPECLTAMVFILFLYSVFLQIL